MDYVLKPYFPRIIFYFPEWIFGVFQLFFVIMVKSDADTLTSIFYFKKTYIQVCNDCNYKVFV